MSIAGSDFLLTAQRLEENGVIEADFRSSISRAYYASLHEADSVIPPPFVPTPDERMGKSSHVAVLDALNRWGNSYERGRSCANQIRRHLAKLKAKRKEADYRLDFECNKDMATDAIAVAKKILEHVADVRRLTVM